MRVKLINSFEYFSVYLTDIILDRLLSLVMDDFQGEIVYRGRFCDIGPGFTGLNIFYLK